MKSFHHGRHFFLVRVRRPFFLRPNTVAVWAFLEMKSLHHGRHFFLVRVRRPFFLRPNTVAVWAFDEGGENVSPFLQAGQCGDVVG